MIFQKYYEELVFDVINTASYNIISGILWLKKHNPQINWKREKFIIKYKCVFDLESRHQSNVVKDKKRNLSTEPKKVVIFNPKKDILNEFLL